MLNLTSPGFTPQEAPAGCLFHLNITNQVGNVCVHPTYTNSSRDNPFYGPFIIGMGLVNEHGQRVLSQLQHIQETDWGMANFYFDKGNLMQNLGHQLADRSITFNCEIVCQVKTECYYTPSGINLISALSTDMEGMFDSMEYSDAIFNVCGREFRAHKSILAARSPFFASKFKESELKPINDVEPQVFNQILRFIYTGRVSLDELKKTGAGLFIAAQKYRINELKSECELYLIRHMSPDNCAELLLRGSCITSELSKKAGKFYWIFPQDVQNTAMWKQETQLNPFLIQTTQVFLSHFQFAF